ncbi:threonine/serine dehydratase [Microbacterium aoyamense]|uniref:Threonine/serine dehydratase n=1 Tax=Microbacterium aoyamense TaxID=344166 RepID=A0ABN2Q1W8_9MICO|nr:serine/threonine dehydratase [Microbacterium aoyamense]
MPADSPTSTHLDATDIRTAAARLDGRIRRTPVMWIDAGTLGATHPAFWLKLESLQVTGAFKARGALNSMLAQPIPDAGVCAASGGNHGQAVAWAARLLGVPAAIFVPTTCPPVKLQRLAEYGASVTVIGDVYDESLVIAQAYAEQSGARLIHPFDQPATVAGAGTVTTEFLDQVPDLSTVLVSVGGGGLLAGALTALTGTPVTAVGVEPVTARCLGAALDAGAPVDVEVSGAAVDSLGPVRVGRIAFDTVTAQQAHRVEVTDDAIRSAQRTAWNELRIGLEGGGAAALAAILSGAYTPSSSEVVGVVASGGNVDPSTLARA